MLRGLAEPIVSLGEAQAYVRIETGEEEAILAGLIRTSSAICEDFLRQIVVQRAFREAVRPTGSWQRLTTSPIQAITGMERQLADGTTTSIPAAGYTVDIDATGDGWVQLLTATPGQMFVMGTAGIAATTNQVPEPLRQGVLRLVSHLFANRDGGSGEPPAAVTALWQPHRRLRMQ